MKTLNSHTIDHQKGILFFLFYILFYLYSITANASLKEWTLLIYMGGDRSLEPNAINDINAFEKGVDTSICNVIFQLDRIPGYDNTNGNWSSCKRFLAIKDTLNDGIIRSIELTDIGEVNMGDKQTLTDFIIWGMQNYQSKKYAVVIWGSASPMGICPDETSGNDPLNSISGEITQALKQATAAVQKRIDLLVAWGCNFGTFEHDFIVREYVDVIARSQLATWNAEGSATDILQWLNNNPTATAKEFGIAWVDAYTDYAIVQGRCTGWAALDLNPSYVRLGNDVDLFARELIKAGGMNQSDIAAAMANTVYSYALEFDLLHFAKNIANTNTLPQSLQNAAQQVIDTYGYTIPYIGNPLLNFRFSEGIRDPNETWPTGDSTELRGTKIYRKNYGDFEGGPPPFGCDTAYVPFKMNNSWKWFIADSSTLPLEALLTYDSNNIGDSIIANNLPQSLTIRLRNSGGADASNVSAVLTSMDGNVTITTANGSYGNIISEGTGINVSPFILKIDSNVTDGHRIWFSLNISANNNAYNNTTTFCMEVTKNQIVTGINKISNENITAFPNPTEKAVNFILPVSNCNLKIVDELGNTVFEKHLQSNYSTLTLNLKSGIYFYHLWNDNGFHYSNKLIFK